MPALLSNASATGSAVGWSGGQGLFIVVGTFSGATVKMQYMGPDASTWVDVGPDVTLTAAGMGLFALPPGQVRANVSGGPPSGIYANADQVKA